MDIIALGLGTITAYFGLWEIVVLGIAYLIGVLLSQNDKYTHTTILIALITIFIGIIAGPEIYTAIKADPTTLVSGVAIYMAVGIFYSLARWYFLLLKIRNDLINFRKEEKIDGPLTTDDKKKFRSYLDFDYRKYLCPDYIDSIVPRASSNKGRIIHWMACWPFSMPVFLRPVTRLFINVYELLASLFQRIANNMFRNIE